MSFENLTTSPLVHESLLSFISALHSRPCQHHTLTMEKDIDVKLGLPDGTQLPESTTPSALSIMDEKREQQSEHDDFDQVDAKQEEELQRAISSEYPKAFRLITILVAVILSIFLVALDMVRQFLILLTKFVLTKYLDYRGNSNSKNHGRISFSGSSRLVW